MSLIQISAGRGPLECSWVVGKVLQKLSTEAQEKGIALTLLESENESKSACYKSVVLSLEGEAVDAFLSSWIGTIQWIAQSPFRPKHQRKNWFVSMGRLESSKEIRLDKRDVRVDTMRSSGSGGQHVNKTESAVRLTHVPTGTTVVVSAERSQHRNRVLAWELLACKLSRAAADQAEQVKQKGWQNHNELIRGNPVRVFRGNEK